MPQPIPSAERLIFDARSSTRFLSELTEFLSKTTVVAPYAQLVETFSDAASKEGVASAPAGNLVDLAYDWIDRDEWKYFVRLEVDLPGFQALFEAAKNEPLYRDVAVASLIYGGQGILDFKRKVPDYIDDVHQQEDFQAIKFKPQSKKDAEWACRLAAHDVERQQTRYRAALEYLHSRGIEADTLEQRAKDEHSTALNAILLHYAELMGSTDDLHLRIAILLSDVERDSPAVINAVLRIGEKNKQVVFDAANKTFDADYAAFRFLLQQPSE